MANESDWVDVPASSQGEWVDASNGGSTNNSQQGQFNAPSPIDAGLAGRIALGDKMVPFRGASDQFNAGMATGKQLVSPAVLGFNLPGADTIGQRIGATLGAARGLGTGLNFISAPISAGAEASQRVAQYLGDLLAGNESKGLQALAGKREVLPGLQPPAFNTGNQLFNTALNLGGEAVIGFAKNPVTGSLMVAGAGPEIPSAFGSVARGVARGEVLPGGLNTAIKNSFQSVQNSLTLGKNIPPERLIRSALKPKNSQVGNRIETGFQQVAGDIFHANPTADQTASMPIEGFYQTVKSVREATGNQIGDIASLQNKPVNGGQIIADALNKKADALQRSGEPSEDVAYLRSRASDFQQSGGNISDVQDAVTSANRKNSPLFKKDLQAANPQRANVESVANSIISQEGGTVINNVLQSIGGDQAVVLRQKWGNLRSIEDQANTRVNELINKAPAEVKPALVEAFTSPQGIIGVMALLHGWSEGALPALAAIGKSLLRNSEKIFKDPNQKIRLAYDQLRANPPPKPAELTITPPAPLAPPEPANYQPQIDELLRQSLQGRGASNAYNIPSLEELITRSKLTSGPPVNHLPPPNAP